MGALLSLISWASKKLTIYSHRVRETCPEEHLPSPEVYVLASKGRVYGTAGRYFSEKIVRPLTIGTLYVIVLVL